VPPSSLVTRNPNDDQMDTNTSVPENDEIFPLCDFLSTHAQNLSRDPNIMIIYFICRVGCGALMASVWRQPNGDAAQDQSYSVLRPL
jgi:hypothetical protein